MDALRLVPCGYYIFTDITSRTPQGSIQQIPTLTHIRLYRRMAYILNCGDLAGAYVYAFDNIKANTSVFFLEPTFKYVPERMPWGFRKKSIVAPSRHCYFLGKYFNYWNIDNKRIVYANNFMTPNVKPMTTTPFITNKVLADSEKALLASLETTFGKMAMDMFLYPERFPPTAITAFRQNPDPTTPEDPTPIAKKISDAMAPLSLFFKMSELTQYLQESDALRARAIYWAACVKKSYKPPPKPPASRQMKPEDINEVTLPTPTAPPAAPEGEQRPSNVSALNVGYSIAQTGNKLELTLDFDFQEF